MDVGHERAPLKGAVAGLEAGVAAAFAMDRFQAAVTALGGGGKPATNQAADAVARTVIGAPLPEADKPLCGRRQHTGRSGV